MKAKSRYRKRLQLQRALTNVIRVLARNMRERIAADEKTARLARHTMAGLATFVEEAGILFQPEDSDLERLSYILKASGKETVARKKRLVRHILKHRNTSVEEFIGPNLRANLQNLLRPLDHPESQAVVVN
jgi:hypothetical protein